MTAPPDLPGDSPGWCDTTAGLMQPTGMDDDDLAPPAAERATRCPVCASPDAASVCEACRASLALPWGMCPSQLRGRAPGAPTAAALVDRWGGVWRLPRRAVVGRGPSDGPLDVLHGDVARAHALFELSGATWRLTDLGSRTGTWVEQRRVVGATALPPVARVRLGTLELFFLAAAPAAGRATPATTLEADEVTTPFAIEEPHLGAASTPLLVEAASGWGRLSLGAHGVQVPSCQLALLQLLAQRWHDDHATEPAHRGFVAIDRVLAEIPWEATQATRTNLKQLVRRTRQTLAALDVDERLEGRRGDGGAYRLRGGLRLEP